MPAHALHLARPSHALMVVSLSDPLIRARGVAAFARRVQEDLSDALADVPHARLLVAIGSAVEGIEQARDSYAEALQACRVAEQLAGFGEVVHWDDLGIYKLLGAVSADGMAAHTIPAGLRALIEDPRTHPLVRTLECYLDHAGDIQATSAELYLHRTSVYQRLQRLEELLGADLKSGDDRLALHLGLKFACLEGFTWGEEVTPHSTLRS